VNNPNKNPMEQSIPHLVRPVVHRDGRRGQCQCRENGYTITWNDGNSDECADVSYAMASFTDISKRHFKQPKQTPLTQRAHSYERGEW